MAEVKKMLDQWLDDAGKEILINGNIVVDRASGESFSGHIADNAKLHHTVEEINGLIATATAALKDGDLKALSDSVDALSTTLNTFLKGASDGGDIDRLTELVAAINANRSSIDALVADHVKKSEIVNDLTSGGSAKVLSAEQGKKLKGLIDALEAKAHTHANAGALGEIGKAANGNLTFNGKELTGSGIAIVSAAGDTPVFDARLKMVITDYAVGA